MVICQHEANLPINTHVFRLARQTGATTVLNPAPMRTDFDARILALVDVLIPNETEFVALTNLLPAIAKKGFTETALRDLAADELHQVCRAFGVPTVIVTLGKRGCFVSQVHSHATIPAHTGIKVVDTTGAGDAFVGGFAAGLVKFKGDVLTAARFGNTVAALSVTKFGTAPPCDAEGDQPLSEKQAEILIHRLAQTLP